MTLLLAILLIQPEPSRRFPAAIENMIANRMSIVSADIHWTHEIANRLPGRQFQMRNRYALDGSRMFERLGDQDGWVDYDLREGVPRSRFPEQFLENDGGLWQHYATKLGVDLWLPQPTDPQTMQAPPDGDDFKDIRWLGTYWDSRIGFIFGEAVFSGDLPPQARSFVPGAWTVAQSGDIHEVTTVLEGERKVKWFINERRGWNAERIVAEAFPENPEIELRAKLEEFGGVWFPREVELNAGGRVFERFHVTRAKVNADAAIERLTVAELRLEPGVNVEHKNAPPGDPRTDVYFWNGDAVVDLKTWRQQVKSGERQYGPRFKKIQQTGEPDTTYMTKEELERWREHSIAMPELGARTVVLTNWERYVVDFCATFRLDDAQRQKAWLILEECQKAGTEYLDRKKGDFAAAQRSMMKARAAGERDEMKAAQTKLSELQAPLTLIFESQLKPRLEPLPTRAQRAATSQPTSEPASRPTSASSP